MGPAGECLCASVAPDEERRVVLTDACLCAAAVGAAQEWNIVLTSRIIFFLLKTHHHQIVANRVMRTALIPLRRSLREGLRRQKDTLGYNLAALRFVQRQNDARRTAEFFEKDEMLTEEQVREKIAEGGKKRKRVNVKT